MTRWSVEELEDYIEEVTSKDVDLTCLVAAFFLKFYGRLPEVEMSEMNEAIAEFLAVSYLPDATLKKGIWRKRRE